MLGRLLHFLARVTPSQFALFIATVMLSCYTFGAMKVCACTFSGVQRMPVASGQIDCATLKSRARKMMAGRLSQPNGTAGWAVACAST